MHFFCSCARRRSDINSWSKITAAAVPDAKLRDAPEHRAGRLDPDRRTLSYCDDAT